MITYTAETDNHVSGNVLIALRHNIYKHVRSAELVKYAYHRIYSSSDR